MDEPLIRQIGRYQLLDVIGRGGMGIVYRATDGSIGRTVAIKMLHGAYAEDKDLLARFYREVRSTANLQHKNIVTVYALDDFEGFPYMVMEYLEGQSISEMIASRRPLHLVEKIGLICQVCEGLQYAHERNVIHRDIKPANVLVLNDGVAKIVDFGIARVGRSETLTRTGQIIGSIYYMSPEQIGGSSVDARTDIYSAGVMLYQFLAGELPFKAGETDPQATFVKILNDPVPSLGKYLAEYPVVLDEILEKAMAKNADARYQTAEDFGYELSSLQESLKRGMTQQFLSQAKAAIDRKDWESARQQLQEVLRFERRNSEANELFQFVRQQVQRQQRSVQIGQLRSQAQIALAGLQYEEALECVEQARRLDPNDEELTALSQSIKDQVERARELADALRRGQAALYAGDLNEAEIAVRRALQIAHDHTEARALEGLVKRELEERARRSQLQGFVEEARREISSHNFLSALHSLEKAQAIDPADSNIRELLTWAMRGHEQEKLRNELQKHTNEIGKLLGEDHYAEALEACGTALQEFPEEPSLLQLHQLAQRQFDLVVRRRAIDEASAEARRLADADRSDEAIALLEQALRSFPDDPNLETLLAITRAEFERRRQEREERQRREMALAAGQISADAAAHARQEVLDLLSAFQDGLTRKLPISQLRPLAERAAAAVGQHRLNALESGQYSVALAEFKSRSAKWSRDCTELEGLERSIQEAKSSAEAGSLLDRARFLSEQYGKDEEVQRRYDKIRHFAGEFKLKREAVASQVSSLVGSMQASQDLAGLVVMEKRVQEVSAPWLGDAFIRSLVNQAAAHVDEVRQHKDRLLRELAQLSQSLSTARSAGQIRLLEEQAKMLSADFDDDDVRKAIGDLQGIAQNRLLGLRHVISQLQDLATKVSVAGTLAAAENYDTVARKLVSDNPEAEEANDLLRKIQHTVEERRREYRRISNSLESLVVSSAKAAGQAELDLILARRRDLLKKYPEEIRFQELETRLEASVEERRVYLADVAASEQQREELWDEEMSSLDPGALDPGALDPGALDPGGLDPGAPGAGDARLQVTIPAEHHADTTPHLQPKPGNSLLRFAFSAAILAGLITGGVFLVAPKTVTIRTTPTGTNVTVDGRPCRAPCTLKLRAGEHELLAARPGFEELRQAVNVPWLGSTLPVIAMTPLPNQPAVSPGTAGPPPAGANLKDTITKDTITQDARIFVYASVPGASVFVDDSPSPIGTTGKDGGLQVPASAGSHRVRVEKPGFEKSPDELVKVAKNGEAAASFDLKPLTGTPPGNQETAAGQAGTAAKLGSLPTPPSTPPPAMDTFVTVEAPAGAEIHIDQQVAGHSTGGPLKTKVQPGQKTVEVFLSGYQPWNQTVSVAAGSQVNIVANLSHIPVPIVPPSQPPLPQPGSAVSDEDRKQIQQLLDRYADGYSQKNVKLIQAAWPSIHPDQVKKIKEFLKDSKTVSMKLHLVGAIPAGKRITIDCTQTLDFDENGKPQSQTSSITLYVVKSDAGWLIDFIPNS